MVARQRLMRIVVAACLCACWAQTAAAQSLGTFRWQAEPFCNVIALSVVQVGTVFTLDGFDDQCGAATRASVVGTAFFNLDGSVGIGLTTVATPGGGPVHMDVALSVATLGGPWRDSAGNVGTFVFTPGSGTGGPGRPIGRGIGTAAIDPGQVQRRVTGTCTAGSVVRSINEDGTVGCEIGGAGDITAVTAGAGLTGGATTGAAALAVDFAGTGVAATAARSDHRHQAPGISNTAVGEGALNANSGIHNTAVGSVALIINSGGLFNTALGAAAGNTTTTASFNTFIGSSARSGIGTLENASALGALALVSVSNAMVLGSIAGVNGATSNVNVGIGTAAPAFPLQVVSTDGAGQIHVGSHSEVWSAGERRVISFGDSGLVYVGEEDADDRLVLRGGVGGVRFKASPGQSVAPNADNLLSLGGPSNRWTAVYAVNGAIQTSDARWKTNIADLDYGLASLLRLRPVSFQWKDGDTGQVNLGLLAQDVERVIPEAVVHGASPDEPLGMNYSTLVPVLIKAIQQQESELRRQDARVEELVKQVSALQQLIGARP